MRAIIKKIIAILGIIAIFYMQFKMSWKTFFAYPYSFPTTVIVLLILSIFIMLLLDFDNDCIAFWNSRKNEDELSKFFINYKYRLLFISFVPLGAAAMMFSFTYLNWVNKYLREPLGWFQDVTNMIVIVAVGFMITLLLGSVFTKIILKYTLNK